MTNIIANNLASQAQGFLKKDIKFAPTDEALVYESLINDIDRAIHFQLPAGGSIFQDNLRGIKGSEVRLPFPVITFSVNMNGHKYLFMASEHEAALADLSALNCSRSIRVRAMVDCEEDGWLVCCFESFIGIEVMQQEKANLQSDRPPDFDCVLRFLSPYYEDILVGEHLDLHKQILNTGLTCLLELIEALTCTNVRHEPINIINRNVNRRRVKNGKLPLFEIRTLILDSNHQAESIGYNPSSGENKATVRQHLRRGHIRRLPKGNIWINSMVVGSLPDGVIVKNYELR